MYNLDCIYSSRLYHWIRKKILRYSLHLQEIRNKCFSNWVCRRNGGSQQVSLLTKLLQTSGSAFISSLCKVLCTVFTSPWQCAVKRIIRIHGWLFAAESYAHTVRGFVFCEPEGTAWNYRIFRRPTRCVTHFISVEWYVVNKLPLRPPACRYLQS